MAKRQKTSAPRRYREDMEDDSSQDDGMQILALPIPLQMVPGDDPSPSFLINWLDMPVDKYDVRLLVDDVDDLKRAATQNARPEDERDELISELDRYLDLFIDEKLMLERRAEDKKRKEMESKGGFRSVAPPSSLLAAVDEQRSSASSQYKQPSATISDSQMDVGGPAQTPSRTPPPPDGASADAIAATPLGAQESKDTQDGSADAPQNSKFKPPFQVPRHIKLPEDELVHKIIEKTALFVRGSSNPSDALAKLRSTQSTNPKFAFLQDGDVLHGYFEFLTRTDEQRHQLVLQSIVEQRQLHQHPQPKTAASPSPATDLKSTEVQETAAAGRVSTTEKPSTPPPPPKKRAYKPPKGHIDRWKETLIIAFVDYVQAYGLDFVFIVRERLRSNPAYSFLQPSDPGYPHLVYHLGTMADMDLEQEEQRRREEELKRQQENDPERKKEERKRRARELLEKLGLKKKAQDVVATSPDRKPDVPPPSSLHLPSAAASDAVRVNPESQDANLPTLDVTTVAKEGEPNSAESETLATHELKADEAVASSPPSAKAGDSPEAGRGRKRKRPESPDVADQAAAAAADVKRSRPESPPPSDP